jgi:ribulose-phosphate 3-epimerase
MATICPTVMGASSREYREAIERVAEFAERIHIDFADGVFAPTKLEPIDDAWWPIGLVVDFHIMYQKPLDHLETVINHQPSLAIVHAEADGALDFLKELEGMGIRRGIALLKDTPVSVIEPYIQHLDHVLVFSGDLGHYGGRADLELLEKVKALKVMKSELEVGWDGGINDQTASGLAKGGVDVLNVGGFIQKAADPENAYDTLLISLNEVKQR